MVSAKAREAQVLGLLHLTQGKGEQRDCRNTLGGRAPALLPSDPHLGPAVPGVVGGGRHRPFPSPYHVNLPPLLRKRHP